MINASIPEVGTYQPVLALEMPQFPELEQPEEPSQL